MVIARRARPVLLGISASLLSLTPASAHDHSMTMAAPVGHVHFKNSCSAGVSDAIDRGVSLLYSFWYDEAGKAFADVAEREPDCAIAYWGQAMSQYQQVERLPSGAQLVAGQQALAKAAKASRTTSREAAYVDALTIIYDEKAVPAHATRAQNYADAMERLSATYPDDYEAAVFHALALLSPELPDDPDLLRARRALTILNTVLKVEPDNPGVIHYIIHASDNPHMASLGLAAARRYAQIAPASSHALHMPGHIFARLGLWDEDIASNLASKAAAEGDGALHIGAQNRLHAMEFLQYAYLQTGRDDEARAITAPAGEIKLGELDPGFEAYHPWVEASLPARLALETRDWAGALKLKPHAEASPNVQRVTYWAQAVAAGQTQNSEAAAGALAKYRATSTPAQLEAAAKTFSAPWAETRAWTLFAAGDTDAAIALLRPVADHQDKVGKPEVELPAREMIGDMLRLSGRPAEALGEYRTSLQTDPGRFNTLLHAGQVASALGLKSEAAGYYRLLLKNAVEPSPLSKQALGEALASNFGDSWIATPGGRTDRVDPVRAERQSGRAGPG